MNDQNNTSIILKLQNLIDINFNNSDINTTIARTLLDNLDKIQDLSISDLANSSFTSPASITRFSKKMGFKGFKGFAYALINEKMITHSFIDEQTDELESDNNKLDDFKNNILRSINSIHDFNAKQVNNICDEIINANEVCFFGIGTNADLLKIFNRELMILGINTKYYNDYDDQIRMSNHLKENDLAIIFSFSMIGSVIEKIFKNVLNSNVSTVIATHNESFRNGIHKLKFVIIPKNESSFSDEHSKATFAYLYLILGIISVLKEKLSTKNKEFKNE